MTHHLDIVRHFSQKQPLTFAFEVCYNIFRLMKVKKPLPYFGFLNSLFRGIDMKQLVIVPIFLLFSQIGLSQQTSSDVLLLEMQLQNAIRMSDGYFSQLASSNTKRMQELYFGYTPISGTVFTESDYNAMLAKYVTIEPETSTIPLVPRLIGAFLIQSAMNSYIMQGNPYTNVTLRYRKQFLIRPDLNLQLREVGNFVPVSNE